LILGIYNISSIEVILLRRLNVLKQASETHGVATSQGTAPLLKAFESLEPFAIFWQSDFVGPQTVCWVVGLCVIEGCAERRRDLERPFVLLSASRWLVGHGYS
jgi:hypothetical protein